MQNYFSKSQNQTEQTFSFKWNQESSYGSEHMDREWGRWLLEKYFDSDPQGPSALLNGSTAKLKILDAGCGSGKSALLLFGSALKNHDYVGVDISTAVNIAQEAFARKGIPGRFVQSSLDAVPEEFGNFDVVFSEGVLHHTDSVSKAIDSLASRLVIGGKFLFYVYAKKAPVREFTDDLIRDSISILSDADAWAALLPLTKFGKTLGELELEVKIEEDIPLLGIKRGTYDLQRLFYYHFFKAYHHRAYTLEEMNHINFDWFRPANCHRHTRQEIEGFVESAGLVVDRFHEEPSGYTVIASKIS
jgi:SAM-dependent methyltransferase